MAGERLSNGKYLNPKLNTWDGEIMIRFKGNCPGFIRGHWCLSCDWGFEDRHHLSSGRQLLFASLPEGVYLYEERCEFCEST